eukprot:GFYU01010095.1.p1 GENE.GFYU01010095.1~~GFYU01010095.1.p1  ORF type:complete len:407 (-),score=116.87 GFYU01010095.1:41-1240(-)
MPDFTIGSGKSGYPDSTSTIAGACKNAYNAERSPYGSSGGTGAAVAASFGVIGMAEDTQGSIQMPAAAEGMIGVRPTQGLVSSAGMFPLVPVQDMPGPICRSVMDAATVLEVLVDPTKVDNDDCDVPVGGIDSEYVAAVNTVTPGDTEPLSDVKIGFSRDVFGTYPFPGPPPERVVAPEEAVVTAVNEALGGIAGLGAEVSDVNVVMGVSDLLMGPKYANVSECGLSWNRAAINEYLSSSLQADCAVKDIGDILSSGFYKDGDATLAWLKAAQGATVPPEEDPACALYKESKVEAREFVLKTMKDAGVDYILYPTFNRLPMSIHGDPTDPVNIPITFISASTGLPAVVFPVDYAEDGTPISVSITGPPYSEAKLLMIAHAFEQNVFRPKKVWPKAYPPL